MMLPLDAGVRRRVARWSLSLALLAYVALAYAEQGTTSVGLGGPPAGPLPFARERVFGLDLRGMSSIDALTWLRGAGPDAAALVAVPIDADVVGALGREDMRDMGYGALDLLVAAAGGEPLAVCLHKPRETVGTLALAQAVVGALSERYTDSIAYIAACEPSNRDWQLALAQAALKADAPDADLDSAFVPLSAGAPIEVRAVERDELSVSAVRGMAGGEFVLLDLSLSSAPDVDMIRDAVDLLRGAAHVGLVMLRPAPGSDPAPVVAVTRGAVIAGTELPQGYSASAGGSVAVGPGWQATRVGTVTYLQAQQSGAILTIEFVGSELYVLGLMSPEGGVIEGWLDRDPTPGGVPDTLIDFVADQAHDASVDAFDGLSAARHRVTFVAAEGTVVAGFFVAGRTQPGWARGAASVGLIVVAAAALADLSYVAIQDIRQRSPVPGRRRRRAHPRGFERSR